MCGGGGGRRGGGTGTPLAKCFCNMFFGFALTPICDKHCILGAFRRLTTCVGFPVLSESVTRRARWSSG